MTINNFSNGTVSVSGTVTGCAVSSNPRTLNVSGVPATPSGINVTFPPCNFGLGQFQASLVTGATGYTWTVPNNGTTIDQGQGTSTVDVIWGNGTGTMTVKAFNSCGNSGTRALAYTPGCRINQESESQILSDLITVFPNPAQDYFIVHHYAFDNSSVRIELYDVTGRLVYVNEFKASEGENDYRIEISDLAKGPYQLRFITDNNIVNKSVIIE